MMRCFNCGATLSEKKYCMSCGMDVALNKKVIRLSNLYYNDGLVKAEVRDLSGAIVSLKSCLKFNKEHVMARNLLGLVYFEIGEIVSALSQWVISTNMQSKDNIAEEYIHTVQSNQGRLDAINQTIPKYNLALEDCKQNSEDLAIIQLKKVLSVNNHLLQGHQLLALLYMKQEEYEKAYKQLKRAGKIDSANTITMHLIQSLNEYMRSAQPNKKGSQNEIDILSSSRDNITYRNGNEMIIQPMNIKENNGFWTVVNILIGLLVGAALVWFLGTPAKIYSIKSEYQRKENSNYELLDAKNADIDSLNATIDSLRAEIETHDSDMAAYQAGEGELANLEKLIEAERIYIEGDIAASFDVLVTVDREVLSETTKASWQSLYDKSLSVILTDAKKLYNRGTYEEAIAMYNKILAVDPGNMEALYNIGNSYRKNKQNEEAIQAYTTLLQLYPDGTYTSNVNNYLKQLNAS